MAQWTFAKPVKTWGVTLIITVNVLALAFIGFEALSLATYKGSTPGSYTMAEAAYYGALSTNLLVSVASLIGFNVLTLGVAICNRINRLHQAVSDSAALQHSSGGQ